MTTPEPAVLLHSYFRSAAAYRVRIALNLKGVAYRMETHHLRRNEHRAPDYLAINPQGLIPALEVGGAVLTQSLAICEYLEEVHPEPALLPKDPIERAKVRAFADAIACDIHPVQNLRVLGRVRDLAGEEASMDWARWVIGEGLDACAALVGDRPGPFCFGDRPTLADVFLVPQMVNVRRFGVEARWPRLLAAEEACRALPAFRDAAPENQPDAE